MLTRQEMTLVIQLQRSAHKRLKELHGLWSDLLIEAPTARDEVTDDLIELRETEVARVLDIFATCQQLIDATITEEG